MVSITNCKFYWKYDFAHCGHHLFPKASKAGYPIKCPSFIYSMWQKNRICLFTLLTVQNISKYYEVMAQALKHKSNSYDDLHQSCWYYGFLNEWMTCHFKMWDSISSFPFVRDGRVYPERGKKGSTDLLIFLVNREFEMVLLWLSSWYLGYKMSIHLQLKSIDCKTCNTYRKQNINMYCVCFMTCLQPIKAWSGLIPSVDCCQGNVFQPCSLST